MPRRNFNVYFVLFLLSQCISALGDAFQLVASTSLIVEITGTGLSAGFLLVCTPIASLIFSAYAGSLGDRFSEKKLLIVFDLLRAGVTALFVLYRNLWMIYFLTLLSTIFDIFYGPSRKKILSALLDEKKIMTGNSLLTGASGLAFIIGPILAGIMIDRWSVDIAFLINSASYLVSGLVIALIKVDGLILYSAQKEVAKRRSNPGSIGNGIKYLKQNLEVREMMALFTLVSSCIASMNLAFYPFVFDTLKVTQKGWGILMSIFYGTNLAAMLIQIYWDRKIYRHPMKVVCGSLLCISMVWYGYGMSTEIWVVLILIFFEGTAEAICGIVLVSRMQLGAQQGYIARTMGINDLVNNFGKLIAIAMTYLCIGHISCKGVFMVNATILILFVIYNTFSNKYK